VLSCTLASTHRPNNLFYWPCSRRSALINVAGAGELCAAWTNVDVAFRVEDKVSPAEGAVKARRFIPYRNMRRDVAIHQCFENSDRTVNTVACEPLRVMIEAACDPVNHSLGNRYLGDTVGARALSVDDDPSLIVDEIVCIVSKERINALPRTQAACGSVSEISLAGLLRVPLELIAVVLVICAGSIESGSLLSFLFRTFPRSQRRAPDGRSDRGAIRSAGEEWRISIRGVRA
jgi:hypothetical protein